MVYGIVMLINFAHGDILMVGAYAGYFILTALAASGMPYLALALAFAGSMILCGFLGIIIEKFAYRPLRNAPRLNSLITAIAVSLILQNGMRVLPFVGPNPRPFPGVIEGKLALGTFSISYIQLIVICISALLMILLTILINYTKTGKAMRAVSFDMQAASLMGISVNRTISFTFALGSVLAAAGGILYASAYPQIDPVMGAMPGLKAFVAAVLGGIGSVPGAMLGGFILGIAETLTKGYINSQYADAISFSILIIILLIKPSGLLGKNIRVKV